MLLFSFRGISFSTVVLGSAIALSLAATARAQSASGGAAARGQYIFELAGGCACHSEPKKVPNTGGRAFPVPLGTVYSTNITQDKETGLGAWSDEEIRDALVNGKRRDGSRIVPVMPYEAYSGMAKQDLDALIAYLRTLKPVRNPTPPEKTSAPGLRSVAVPLWLKVFGKFSTAPDEAPKSGGERGRYLVEHVSICGDCHTPRNYLGVLQRDQFLAGVDKQHGPFGQAVPNITPDDETGIGTWKREDIAEVLISGTKPDLDNVQGLMAEVVEHGFKHMSRDDALAIADYVRTMPAIKNKVE